MKHANIAAALCLLAVSVAAYAGVNGLVKKKSPYSVAETEARFVNVAHNNGLKIFNEIDHAQGARRVGMSLLPTRLVIFGNPKGGTPLMQCAQTIGIDLPLKALVWKAASGQVWLGYNSPAYIARRHGVPNCPAVAPIAEKLKTIAEQTVIKR